MTKPTSEKELEKIAEKAEDLLKEYPLASALHVLLTQIPEQFENFSDHDKEHFARIHAEILGLYACWEKEELIQKAKEGDPNLN